MLFKKMTIQHENGRIMVSKPNISTIIIVAISFTQPNIPCNQWELACSAT